MKAALYARVSTDKDEQATSLERQRVELERYAEQNGYTIVLTVEEKESGYEVDRPGILQILDAMRQNKLEAVIVQDETQDR